MGRHVASSVDRVRLLGEHPPVAADQHRSERLIASLARLVGEGDAAPQVLDVDRCDRHVTIRRECGAWRWPRSSSGTTPSTWWMLTPPSSKPRADAAMYSNHTRARRSPTSVTAQSHSDLRLATQLRSVIGVVLAEALHVAHLEPGDLHQPLRVGDVDQLAVGEHIPPDERPPSDLRSGHAGDGVVEEPAAGDQQRVQRVEVHRCPLRPDVFEHADRRHGVERLAARVRDSPADGSRLGRRPPPHPPAHGRASPARGSA